MARQNTRSPSPTGSLHSRKSTRDRRDEPRGYRRRSRSRSADRRHRDQRDHDDGRRHDRPSHRRDDRLNDRRDDRRDDEYRRRDRSRDRRRSRDRYNDRSPDRHRRRSRDRDPRDRRDAPLDKFRRRGDDSTDRPREARAASHTRTSSSRNVEASKASTVSGPSDEDKKAERLAKLEAWKKKVADDKARKEREAALGSAASSRKLLKEIDQKAISTPATASPASPPVSLPATTSVISPAPYVGKFDLKAITKRSTSSSQAPATLGTDIAISGTSTISTAQKGVLSHDTKPATFSTTSKASALPSTRGNLSGFGLGAKSATENERSSKRNIDFDDEDDSRKKLQKLTSLPLMNGNDVEMLQTGATEEDDDDVAQDDDDVDMEDVGNEEAAAAARTAAEKKREERLQEEEASTDGVTDLTQDVTMAESAKPQESIVQEDDDEVDPLDAFMDELEYAAPKPSTSFNKTKRKSQQIEPEAMYGDEEDQELKALDNDPDDILAMASKRKKKDIPTINYSEMDLEPIRKNFYTEPAELAEMNENELADLRLELDGIKVGGEDVPKPVQKWSQCGLNVQILEVIRKLEYERPTAIQMQAIPAIMSGRDVIGVAKTGSGKTIAFLLPMFRHIRDQRPLETNEGPVGLIMTPTRELATQIHKECKPFLKSMGMRAVCAYGGAPIKDQIADLKRGAEVIVCTPGRMIDLLAANSGRVTNLKRVTYVVLDEADRMFDMGFEPQVMKIFANIRPDRQTIMFSATMPRIMDALAKKTLNNSVEITVGGKSVVAPEITQIVEVREEKEKFYRTLELLGELYDKPENDDARSLIFVDRQEKADDLLADLMRKGYPCMSIHGGKDQIDRDSTIDDFKAGVTPIMIATSVAARGLDVKQLKLVINFDAPNHLEDYVHRAGRTGRAGQLGTAVTFVTEEQEQYSVGIAKALEQSGQPVPERLEAMRKSFRDKVKAGKSKDSSGFGGKGLEKLDAEREQQRNRERKTHKTEGDDDDDKADDKDDILGIAEAASVVKALAAPAAAPQLIGVPKGIDLDGKITVHKTEHAATTGPTNKLDKVAAAIDSINSRLNKTGQLRQGVPIDNKGPDAGAFHATLEINDFPQKARWAVTNRTNVAKILEATGTSITTKGSFYAAGKEVPAGGDPKLYILVEGDTEVVVTNAMRELMRLLKEGTMAAADAEVRAPTSGRYNVV